MSNMAGVLDWLDYPVRFERRIQRRSQELIYLKPGRFHDALPARGAGPDLPGEVFCLQA